MKLKSIEYKNFWAVGSTPIVIDLDNEPLTVLTGRNGAGKSSVIECITYALFGRLMSNVKIAQAINNKNKKNLLVTLNFEANGSNYTIKRGQKPKVFEIIKDDMLIDQSASEREYQKLLEVIIGCDYKTFIQVVALNKERYVPFMDMKPAQRRQVIDEILDIGIYTAIDRLAATRLSNAKTDYQRAVSEKRVTETKIKGKEELIASLTKGNDDRLQELEDEEQKVKVTVDDLLADAVELRGSIEEMEKELLSFNEPELNSIRQDIAALKADNNASEKSLTKTHKFFSDNNTCPVCNQSIDIEFKAKEMERIQHDISAIAEELSVLDDESKTLSEQIELMNDVKSVITSIKSQLNANESSTRHYNQQLQTIENKRKQLLENDHNTGLATANAELEALHELLETNTKTIIEFDAVVARYEAIREQTSDTGVKAKIISEYLPVFNRKINEYLYEMEFYVGLELNESFEETFKAANKAGFSYDQLSTGQKCRVNLAIWMALLEIASIKNSVVTNVLFLDEILEPMDAVGVELFINLCRNKLRGTNVYVITQRAEEFKPMFDRSIEFVLNNDFTEKQEDE